MAKPIVEARPCVRITITDPDVRGVGIDSAEHEHCLTLRLLAWMRDQGINPVAGTSGWATWFHYGDYAPADAKRILGWLSANGADVRV